MPLSAMTPITTNLKSFHPKAHCLYYIDLLKDSISGILEQIYNTNFK